MRNTNDTDPPAHARGERRAARRRARAAALALLLLLSGCGEGAPYRKYERTFFGTFDTVVQIIGYAESQAEFDGLAERAEARFKELNRLYDMYNDYPGVANVKTVNDCAGRRAVRVAPEIVGLIRFATDWNAKCPGVINIALGSVLSLWHEYRERGLADPAGAALPPADALRQAAGHADIGDIAVDGDKGTVFLRDPLMRIDVGSVAKGYATEIVAEELQAQGYRSFVINSGGNVRAVGAPLDGTRSKWSVGITDPADPGGDASPGALLDTAFVSDAAVTTAGDYQRYYTVGGKRYSHIIDPATLMPAERYRAVTVAAPDSGVADFMDTLLFILPYGEGMALAESQGVEALWVFPDGSIKATDGMKSILKNMGGATAK